MSFESQLPPLPVVGGIPANIKQFPHMVILNHKFNNNIVIVL